MNESTSVRTPPEDSALPSTEGGRQPDAAAPALLLLLLAARLAVARARDEAAREMTAAKAAWAQERDTLEIRRQEASTEHQSLLARLEQIEADAHAAKEAADVERAELIGRLERAQAEVQAAKEAADAERAELLARVERAEAEAQAAKEAADVERAELLARVERAEAEAQVAREAATSQRPDQPALLKEGEEDGRAAGQLTTARTVEPPAARIRDGATLTDDLPDDECGTTMDDPIRVSLDGDAQADSVKLTRLRLQAPLAAVLGGCGGWPPAARRTNLGGLPTVTTLGAIACDRRDDDPDRLRDDKFITLTTEQGREARGSLGPRGPPGTSG